MSIEGVMLIFTRTTASPSSFSDGTSRPRPGMARVGGRQEYPETDSSLSSLRLLSAESFYPLEGKCWPGSSGPAHCGQEPQSASGAGRVESISGTTSSCR